MKNIDIQVISKQSIKPSAPTPDHLRHYQLSFLDQIAPTVFMPMIFFYPKQADHINLTKKQLVDRIKNSLSESLTLFYPLAGRVKNKLYVECNDEGACYFEAEAKCKLSDILQNPNPQDMNHLLPFELDDVNGLPLIVQVTFFECEGITLGVGMNHEVADALSLINFLNTWSAFSRGETDFRPPIFGTAKLFPPRDMSDFTLNYGIVKDNIVAKRFVFNAAKIAALRNRCAEEKDTDNYQKRPTRVEALSAFLWNRFMASTQPKETRSNKIYTILHAVNIRSRMEPVLAENYFGNISRVAISVPSMEKEEGFEGILKPVKDSINNINPEFVKTLQQTDGGHLEFLKQRSTQVSKGEVISFSFTSLCRLPVYETDFGWGNPLFAGSTRLTFKNLVTFFDTKIGDGIEAWINLKEEDMAKFEVDEELLEFVSPTLNANKNLIN
ncbi:stemmadenine O-acetyltransferase [Ziziphus jujuba]|uniref:Stemmadenine O-acetyltransferase n=1 Tax=Ziziphus jujuba TaxID=326968 RepID=A0A6P6GIE0_ZIZJJ|nr:stemmadenine O-acetyltransferase [Ziziphus jujuba]